MTSPTGGHALRVQGAAAGHARQGVRAARRAARPEEEEEVDFSEYEDFGDDYWQLGRFLDDVYDWEQTHSSLGYLTLVEFEQQWLRGRKATALR